MWMLHGRLAAERGKRDELLAILREVEEAAPMPGCRLYLIAVDPTDEDGIWVTEVWEDEAAHAASLGLDHVRAQIERARPLLDLTGFRQQRLDPRTVVLG